MTFNVKNEELDDTQIPSRRDDDINDISNTLHNITINSPTPNDIIQPPTLSNPATSPPLNTSQIQHQIDLLQAQLHSLHSNNNHDPAPASPTPPPTLSFQLSTKVRNLTKF